MPAPRSLVFRSSEPWDGYHAARLADMTAAERIAERWNESRELVAWVSSTHRAGLAPVGYAFVEQS